MREKLSKALFAAGFDVSDIFTIIRALEDYVTTQQSGVEEKL